MWIKLCVEEPWKSIFSWYATFYYASPAHKFLLFVCSIFTHCFMWKLLRFFFRHLLLHFSFCLQQTISSFSSLSWRYTFFNIFSIRLCPNRSLVAVYDHKTVNILPYFAIFLNFMEITNGKMLREQSTYFFRTIPNVIAFCCVLFLEIECQMWVNRFSGTHFLIQPRRIKSNKANETLSSSSLLLSQVSTCH